MRVTALNIGSTIIDAIPEIRLNIEEWAGLCHLQFSELFAWTETSVQRGQLQDLVRVVGLIDTIFQDCDAEIKNAIAVSFLENIDPDNKIDNQIFNALTPSLQDEWHKLDQYMQKLVGKSIRGRSYRTWPQFEK